jgi:predicted enzyme related to lactoylglutathione lyase
MDRLMYVIIFTGDVPGMKQFYESAVGLVARQHSPEWVELDTAGATLVLSPSPKPKRHGIELRFATQDLDARARALAARGVSLDPPGIRNLPWGRIASLSDPERNPLTLWQPMAPYVPGTGPVLSAVVNSWDMEATKEFYASALGFPVVIDSAWWVQLSVGEAGMGLHPRVPGRGSEEHHAAPITIGLAVPGLLAWYEEALARGLEFKAPPGNRGFGLFADAADPDGNPITFRDLPVADEPPESLEERLAEPFEDDGTPRRVAIRKSVKKGVAATSRLMVKPKYRSAKPATARRRPSKPVQRVASPRGTGPAGARQKPKRKHDPKRARAKPAIGRLRKAERRTFKSQKQAVAGVSKRKPVKRASRPRATKRAVARMARTR